MEKQLISQCLSGNLKGVESLLERGFSPNLATTRGESVLITVCSLLLEALEIKPQYCSNQYGQEYGLKNAKEEIDLMNLKKMIELLLTYGGRPDYCDKQGRSAFHLAAMSGDVNVVKGFMETSVDINLVDMNHNTILHTALSQSSKDPDDIVEYCIQSGMCPKSYNRYGQTPLHFAARNRYFKSIEILLKNGVDVNVQCNDGHTPLVFMLTNQMSFQTCILQHVTLEYEFEKSIDLLLQSNTKLGIKNRKGKNAIHYIVETHNVTLWNKLMRAGGDRLIDKRDVRGNTALHLSISKGIYMMSRCTATWKSMAAMVTAIIKSGSLLNTRNKSDCTPVCVLIATDTGNYKDKEKVILAFLSAGLDMDTLPQITKTRILHFHYVGNRVKSGSIPETINMLVHVFGMKFKLNKCHTPVSMYIKECQKEVRSLQNLCAEIIRKRSFPNAVKAVKELVIPTILKELIVPKTDIRE